MIKIISLFILIITALLVCEKNLPEDKLPEKTLINYKIYANEQNSSYLPYEAECSFEVVWNKPGLFAEEQLSPFNLAVTDSFILTWYGTRIDLRRKQDGEPLWKDQISAIADFDLKEEGFVTVDNFGFYVILNLESRDEQKMSLPFLSIQSRLYFSQKNGKEMSYCYQMIPTPTNAPGDTFTGPQFSYSRFLPEERKFIWEFTKPEIVKAVLRTVDKKRISIVTEKNIYNFDTDAVSDNQVQKLEVGKILGASLDHSGNLLIYLENEKGKFELRNMTEKGDINWKCEIEKMPSLQPPASHPDGNVYILQSNKLECINDGEMKWSYKLPARPGKAIITILKDASVLVSAELSFLHISSEGAVLAKKIFESQLTCRPLVDENGNIYVATPQSIYCMK